MPCMDPPRYARKLLFGGLQGLGLLPCIRPLFEDIIYPLAQMECAPKFPIKLAASQWALANTGFNLGWSYLSCHQIILLPANLNVVNFLSAFLTMRPFCNSLRSSIISTQHEHSYWPLPLRPYFCQCLFLFC